MMCIPSLEEKAAVVAIKGFNSWQTTNAILVTTYRILHTCMYVCTHVYMYVCVDHNTPDDICSIQVRVRYFEIE